MILKNVQKIFEIFYWGGRGVIKGQFFFSISRRLSHSKSILIFPIFCKIDPIGGGGAGGDQKFSFAIKPFFSDFLQNRSDRGGGAGGTKNLVCDFTKDLNAAS